MEIHLVKENLVVSVKLCFEEATPTMDFSVPDCWTVKHKCVHIWPNICHSSQSIGQGQTGSWPFKNIEGMAKNILHFGRNVIIDISRCVNVSQYQTSINLVDQKMCQRYSVTITRVSITWIHLKKIHDTSLN